jgi:hypothetical protein
LHVVEPRLLFPTALFLFLTIIVLSAGRLSWRNGEIFGGGKLAGRAQLIQQKTYSVEFWCSSALEMNHLWRVEQDASAL